MNKKLISLLLAVCMLAALLVGCAGEKEPAAEASEPQNVTENEAENVAEETAPAEEESAADDEAPVEEEPEHVFMEGAGVFPVADGDETLTIWDGWFPFFSNFFADYNETLFFTEMEKRTGIKTEFTLVNAETESEMFNLMVASGDYSDLVHDVERNYTGGLDAAWEEEVIIALDELIDDWMPNYYSVIHSEDEFIQALTSDMGNIYEFAVVHYTAEFPDYGLMIRQDWLNELNMDRPQTYDQYYEVLKAFKTEKGASAPMMLGHTGGFQGNLFCSGYGVNASTANSAQPFYQVDGEVKYGPMEEGYKKYLAMMAQWYSEGLIYEDFYTDNESHHPPEELVNNDQMGVFAANNTDLVDRYVSAANGDAPLDLVPAYDPVETEGDTIHFATDRSPSAENGYSVTTGCENPELAARWADYIYSEEGQLLSNYGLEGETFEYDEEGNPMLGDMVLHNPNIPATLALTKYTTFSLVGVYDPYRMYTEFTDAQWESGEIWSMGDSEWAIPDEAQMTTDESAVFASAYGDIATYVAEHTLAVILGQENVDDIWDEYVANIEKMDIATCIAQMKSAYDRYLAG